MKAKEITLEDLGLTPEEMKTIVSGSQAFLAPLDDEGEPEDRTPDTLTKDSEGETS